MHRDLSGAISSCDIDPDALALLAVFEYAQSSPARKLSGFCAISLTSTVVGELELRSKSIVRYLWSSCPSIHLPKNP